MLGVMKLVPLPSDAPAVALANQFKVPALAAADKATVPASQRPAGVVEVTVGVVFTVAITAVLGEVQLAVAA